MEGRGDRAKGELPRDQGRRPGYTDAQGRGRTWTRMELAGEWAGDVNGDGSQDLLLGGDESNRNGNLTGAAWLSRAEKLLTEIPHLPSPGKRSGPASWPAADAAHHLPAQRRG